jgi:hypothetical protein
LKAPAVTRAGSRRPGACQGTNIAPRSTAGTTNCRTFLDVIVHYTKSCSIYKVGAPQHAGHTRQPPSSSRGRSDDPAPAGPTANSPVVAVAWPAAVAGVSHGVRVGEDLWDAYDKMGLSFQQHAAEPRSPPLMRAQSW